MENEAAGLRLNPCEDVNGNPKQCEVGPDNVTITQLSDTVALQVEGIPVFVNPESELMENEAAGLRLNPCEDMQGNVRQCEIGPDNVTVAQLADTVTLQVEGIPVLVNPESELMENEGAALRLNPCETVNGESKECEVGPDNLTLTQTQGVPVFVNPESELQENEVAGARIDPCVDLNGNVKACEVGPDDITGLT